MEDTAEYMGDPMETQPLIKSMPPDTMSKVCCFTVGAFLVLAWCVLDSWNRHVNDVLFTIQMVEHPHLDANTGEVTGDVTFAFTFPLTLAFLQFAFMGIVFLAMWLLFARHRGADLARVRENIFSINWLFLVLTNVFSTFWLQALIMPIKMMSLSVFAASRAFEVPAAAALRSMVIGNGGRFGGHSLTAIALMSATAWLMTYSYSRIAGCLCIWSGHGVELAGVALACIFLLVLILPAANVVCQEAVMVKYDTDPLLMLTAVNFLSGILLVPLLILADSAGWENVKLGMHRTLQAQELYMLVIWFAVQMTFLSLVTAALVRLTGSFWAIALRSMRVMYWWCSQLFVYFTFGTEALSISRPEASFWAFFMMIGALLAGLAMAVDQRSLIEEDSIGSKVYGCGLLGRHRSLEKVSVP